MKDNYDFSDAIKNPFAGKIKGRYTVTIHYDFTNQESTEENSDVTDNSGTYVKEDNSKYDSK